MYNFPLLNTDNDDIDKAYRLALATIACNIVNRSNSNEENPLLLAGLGYDNPWVRDTSINTWNGCGLICPNVTKNTLLSLYDQDSKVINEATGQSWDTVIWAVGAWYQYLYTGDLEFLKTAYEIVKKTLAVFEENEFDSEVNLFRGPACYGDGISAYPDVYVTGDSGILAFAEERRSLCVDNGLGIPMFTLSTNCLYYYVYIIADKMAIELNKPREYSGKAVKLRSAINNAFWSDKKGDYQYIIDKFGGCDSNEGLGTSFAIIFDIADKEKIKKIFMNHYLTDHGVPCVWPTFGRYKKSASEYGRHSGTVWPFIQGFWADAAARCGRIDLFDNEFIKQTDNALKSCQFAEIYHPVTGEMYGGLQEENDKIINWQSMPFQTWSASAYLRNVYMDILGMRFDTDGIHFSPCGSRTVQRVDISGIKYLDSSLSIKIRGNGLHIKEFKINQKKCMPFFPKSKTGENFIEIILE